MFAETDDESVRKGADGGGRLVTPYDLPVIPVIPDDDPIKTSHETYESESDSSQGRRLYESESDSSQERRLYGSSRAMDELDLQLTLVRRPQNVEYGDDESSI